MRTNDRPLADRVAIITGGASGIGRALGEELAHRGCEVVLADRQHALAQEVAKGIVDRGGRATAVELDVRSMPSFQAVADEVKGRAGRIDYLFNNAGIGVGGEMETYAPEDWDDVIDVNLRGVAYGIQAVYPTMRAQRSGHIINTASVAGLIPSPTEGSYTATKHAVVAMSRALRVEAEIHGVRVSVLCPGPIRTPILTGGVFGRINAEGLSKEAMLKMWENLRPIPPEELARQTLDAVARNEGIIVVPRWWKVFWYLDRLSTRLGERLSRAMLKRMRKDFEATGATWSRPGAKGPGAGPGAGG
jgi:NAD(P)-dependent dehydrogenase (short-subunit alcohol dehydrogenase family)